MYSIISSTSALPSFRPPALVTAGAFIVDFAFHKGRRVQLMKEILQKSYHAINCGNVQVACSKWQVHKYVLQHTCLLSSQCFQLELRVFELRHWEIASLWLGSWLCRGLLWWSDHGTHFMGRIHASKIIWFLSHLAWPCFMPSVGKSARTGRCKGRVFPDALAGKMHGTFRKHHKTL